MVNKAVNPASVLMLASHFAEVLRTEDSSGGSASRIQPRHQPQPQPPSAMYHVVVTAGV